MNDSKQTTFENTSFYNLFNEHSKRKETPVAVSEENTFDDISFYVGEDEDFRASESVSDSDISETDSESDEYWSLENESDENPMEAKSKRCIIDISTMSKCKGKSMRRVATEETMALSETDSVYDDASFHNASFDIVPSGCVDNSTDCDDEDGCEIRSEIERFEFYFSALLLVVGMALVLVVGMALAGQCEIFGFSRLLVHVFEDFCSRKTIMEVIYLKRTFRQLELNSRAR